MRKTAAPLETELMPILEPVILTNISQEMIGKSPASSILVARNLLAIYWDVRPESEIVTRALLNSVRNN